MKIFKALSQVLSLIMFVMISGCGREHEQQPAGMDQVVLQTDWFAQPEHGGFYQALARGFYAGEGLNVIILQGGPNAMSTQKILKGTAHFAMNRADAILSMVARDIEVRLVMATLQHDPQGILMHDSNPVRTFSDLNGRRVMAVPGLAWIQWIEAKYGIEMDIVPHDFGLQRFLNDPTFIQQCLVTNEPYYARLAGVNPRVLRLSESGFDPYHGIYCLAGLIEDNPDLVARFVRASVRGWKDFILNDPSPALELIAARNPKMSPEFMKFSYQAMQEEKLVTGSDITGSQVGQLDAARLESLEQEMRLLDLLDTSGKQHLKWYTTRFLPKPGDEQAYGHP